MMTMARPMAMSRSRVQTRISLRRLAAREAALGAGLADAFTAADPAERRGAGFSGEVEAPRCFWSERSILGALLFIARGSRRAPDGILPDAREWAGAATLGFLCFRYFGSRQRCIRRAVLI